MDDFHVAGVVLVDGQRVDHPDGVALPQPFQFGDDLAVEVGMRESQHDELHGSYSHVGFLFRSTGASGHRRA